MKRRSSILISKLSLTKCLRISSKQRYILYIWLSVITISLVFLGILSRKLHRYIYYNTSNSLFIEHTGVNLLAIKGKQLHTENLDVILQENSLDQSFTFEYYPSVYNYLLDFRSIAPTLVFDGYNKSKNHIKKLTKPFQFTYHYGKSDLRNIQEDTIVFYRKDPNEKWISIPTKLDKSKKTATAQSVYLTSYAIVGKVKDNIAPTSEIKVEGNLQKKNQYKSPIVIKFTAMDNIEGLGVAAIFYKIQEQNWTSLRQPLKITHVGHYNIQYYSVDKADNFEDPKTMEFDVIK